MPSLASVDLRMTPDQEDLRAELHEWLAENLPWEYGVGLPPRIPDLAESVAFGRAWQAKLAEGRWVGITWPVELGGRGLGPTEHFVVTEELARARAPELVGRIAINLVAPDPLRPRHRRAATQRWLPPILPAHELWCQLFSEPDAGSRPGLAHHPGRAHRGRVDGDRTQGVDLVRPVRPTGGCAWPAAIPTPPRARRGSPAWSSTCTPRGWTCGRWSR